MEPREETEPDGTPRGWRTFAYDAEMQARRDEYTRERSLALFAGTWNVNGRAPDPNADIGAWVLPRHMPAGGYDVYMLGFQEVQALSGVDAVRADLAKGAAWRTRFTNLLQTHGYTLVADRQLVGILILVYVKDVHAPHVSDVCVSYAGTGFLNAMGNKGAVTARFRLYDHTLSCVACHLAAHDHAVERRNQDFRDVVRKAVFARPPPGPELRHGASADYAERLLPQAAHTGTPPRRDYGALNGRLVSARSDPTHIPPDDAFAGDLSAPKNAASYPGSWIGSFAAVATTAVMDINQGASTTAMMDPNSISILDHDAVFWLGDLNYRINASPEDVALWIEDRDWESLRNADQLREQMHKCDAFRGFYEGKLAFPPTYKLDRFANRYSRDDTGALKRTPAYTDRILWRCGLPDASPHARPDLKLMQYDSEPDCLSSDHRPVRAVFSMTFRVDDPPVKRRVEVDVNKMLDERQRELRPSVNLSSRALELDRVRFQQPARAQLVVTNDGLVPITIAIPSSNFPPWLTLVDSRFESPCKLLPSQSETIGFQALVTTKGGLSLALAVGDATLEASLHVKLNNGKLPDEPFSISGRYRRTSLGTTLDALVLQSAPMAMARALPPPARSSSSSKLPIAELRSEERAQPSALPLPVPKEIWRLVDQLWQDRNSAVDALTEEPRRWIDDTSARLFSATGDPQLVEQVQDAIDTGMPFGRDVNAVAVAACLLRLLRTLVEPVIPVSAYSEALQIARKGDANELVRFLTQIPSLNGNVFRYIVGMLREMPAVRDGTELQNMADVFGETLLAPDVERSGKDMRDRAAFVRLAITANKAGVPMLQNVAVVDLSRTMLTYPRPRQ